MTIGYRQYKRWERVLRGSPVIVLVLVMIGIGFGVAAAQANQSEVVFRLEVSVISLIVVGLFFRASQVVFSSSTVTIEGEDDLQALSTHIEGGILLTLSRLSVHYSDDGFLANLTGCVPSLFRGALIEFERLPITGATTSMVHGSTSFSYYDVGTRRLILGEADRVTYGFLTVSTRAEPFWQRDDIVSVPPSDESGLYRIQVAVDEMRRADPSLWLLSYRLDGNTILPGVMTVKESPISLSFIRSLVRQNSETLDCYQINPLHGMFDSRGELLAPDFDLVTSPLGVHDGLIYFFAPKGMLLRQPSAPRPRLVGEPEKDDAVIECEFREHSESPTREEQAEDDFRREEQNLRERRQAHGQGFG